ncbi:MAG: thioredoxin family protein [Alphaproteobacteria bacterium]|nr:thioredoxin family protein [Alphaproteobacteria bacterium]
MTGTVCDFGWRAVDFSLEGTDGAWHSLQDVRGARGTLVMFLCNHCPYVKGTIAMIVRETAALRPLGIGAIAIMPNDTLAYPQDDLPAMTEFARAKGIDFPYVIDRTQEAARAYGAVCTPEFFGFNAELALHYHGRLCEVRHAAPVSGARRELFEGMTLTAESGQGPADQVPSIGCSIKWRR